MRLRSVLLIGGILASGGCEQPARSMMSSPGARPLRAARIDAHFRLTEEDRQKLIPGFDADALERLLAWITPDLRGEILAGFQSVEDGTRSHGWIVELKDPQLQPLLEEVWAPMWDHVGASDAQIATDAFQFPGREIAAQRRMARKQAPASPE